MTRALLFQSHLPTSFWGDCLLTSTYLINRLPNSKLNFETPYAKLFKEPPDYGSLKAFGCLAYMSQHPNDKLAARTLKTIFIGYHAHQKGYKLLDPLTSTVHVSRHVVFDETQFLFLQFSPSTPPFIPSPLDYFADDYDTPV